MKVNKPFKKHYIAVIGGSISGSEAANLLAKKGFRVVVFEMNKLPYGKIEDGLPNWHVKLRDRQIIEIYKNSKIHATLGFMTYSNWIKKIMPVRLEDLLKNKEECKCQ